MSTIKFFTGINIDKNLAIIVTCNSGKIDSNLFFKNILFLKKRFNAQTCVVASSPGVFGLHEIEFALQAEIVSQFYFSGFSDQVTVDAIMAAKRIGRKFILFVKEDVLISKISSIIRFLNESNFSNDMVHIDFQNQLLLYSHNVLQSIHIASSMSLDELLLEIYQSNLNTLNKNSAFHSDANIISLNNKVSTQIKQDTFSLFLTAEGIKRLGGNESFLKTHLYYSGRRIDEFDDYWTLCDQRSGMDISDKSISSKRMYHVNSSVSLADGCSIIYDINPGFSQYAEEHNFSECINLPRQILSVRLVKNFYESKKHDLPIYFIVSNYNKKFYIYASLYSIIMQTYASVKVLLVDDLSSDDSLLYVNSFIRLLNISNDFLCIFKNNIRKGTYWIRNFIIYKNANLTFFYLINDSDDYSSAQRAYIQHNILTQNNSTVSCFGDVVRVDKDFSLLNVEGTTERYGTASLACVSTIHSKFGYYQTIKKNADTEFIERIKHFSDVESIKWVRYPLLFQTFDGNNLTSDIYQKQSTSSCISQNLDVRRCHVELFKEHHRLIKKDDLCKEFSFPRSTIGCNYLKLGDSFLVDGYKHVDGLLIVDYSEKSELLGGSDFVLKCSTNNNCCKIFHSEKLIFESAFPLSNTLQFITTNDIFHGYVFLCNSISLASIYDLDPAILLLKSHSDTGFVCINQCATNHGSLLLKWNSCGHLNICFNNVNIFFHTSMIKQ